MTTAPFSKTPRVVRVVLGVRLPKLLQLLQLLQVLQLLQPLQVSLRLLGYSHYSTDSGGRWPGTFWAVLHQVLPNSSKLRASLFVTSRWPRSSGQTNYQVHHPPLRGFNMWSISGSVIGSKESVGSRGFPVKFNQRVLQHTLSIHEGKQRFG